MRDELLDDMDEWDRQMLRDLDTYTVSRGYTPVHLADLGTMHIPQGNETVVMRSTSHHVSYAASSEWVDDGMKAVLVVLGVMLLLTLVVVTGWVIH